MNKKATRFFLFDVVGRRILIVGWCQRDLLSRLARRSCWSRVFHGVSAARFASSVFRLAGFVLIDRAMRIVVMLVCIIGVR